LNDIIPYLPSGDSIKGRFIEPFVGSGAVFFALNPQSALLADINKELIDLYRGIRRYPLKVWEIYKSFPKTRKAYYEVRSIKIDKMDLAYRAARTLYLNRTCFKGMWRHNSNGQFNVGYGGQDRRWVISKETLIEVSERLKGVSLKCSDFDPVVDSSVEGDFIFADPPYRPGEHGMSNAHYTYNGFSYPDHQRLAETLKRASNRGVKWAVTNSSHPDILNLFKGNRITFLTKGIGERPGILTDNAKEVLISNYKEVF